jgi:hypothetical protein
MAAARTAAAAGRACASVWLPGRRNALIAAASGSVTKARDRLVPGHSLVRLDDVEEGAGLADEGCV